MFEIANAVAALMVNPDQTIRPPLRYKWVRV